MADQSAELDWKDGVVPVSRQFDDPYYSLDGGLAETRHVFLNGNDLPGRFAKGFHIGELGFGTGLNLLAAWQAWLQSDAPGNLRFTSFEAFPMTPADMARALAAFPEIAELARILLDVWSPGSTMVLEGLEFTLVAGDARATLPNWSSHADAWFLDGFSPAKNPELWEETLLHEVARHTRAGGTLATYTSAGHVRRALQRAGFSVSRQAGFGRKRHMVTARLGPL